MARFDTTRWSIVLQARHATPASAPALALLCGTYRPPVLAYIRRRGYAPDVAEDLTQAFFAQFIERAWHAGADQQRGRFRAYLLTAVKRFLIDRDIEAQRIKRGGGVVFEEIGAAPTLDLASDDTPDAAFDRDWAIAVVDAAMARLRAEAVRAGKLELFEHLAEFVAERPDESEYERLASSLGMRRNTIAVAVHRMRARLRDFVREEIAQTALDHDHLANELRDLRDAFDGIVH
jgi:RNA polymerase sigma-70 factor (ECF subfamily)